MKANLLNSAGWPYERQLWGVEAVALITAEFGCPLSSATLKFLSLPYRVIQHRRLYDPTEILDFMALRVALANDRGRKGLTPRPTLRSRHVTGQEVLAQPQPSRKLYRDGASEVVTNRRSNITPGGVIKLGFPYEIVGRVAVYDELETVEFARQLLRAAPVQRAEPRQVACRLVLAELARRAAACPARVELGLDNVRASG